ncbi:MAG: penicillin-binding transpeptidase domain-containing protein, partial [Bdellovibrio sp.]
EATSRAFSELKRIGGVVAMKSNGEILSWVSAPSFDPNEFSTRISPQIWNALVNDPYKPLRNKVVQDFFPPGSTFKALVGLAALQDGVIDPRTVIYCPGSIQFGRRTYHDHLKQGHGNVTVLDAMERSSNIFFYKMGIALGIDKMHAYISPFGIGSQTGIDVPQEQRGLMPSAEWKKERFGEEWQPGENLSNAIGQGFVAVTPLQLAVAYNAIGLEGKVVKPYVVKRIVDQNGQNLVENQPQVLRDLTQPQSTGVKFSVENFRVMKQGLRRVVQGERGTAKHVHIPGADIGGKTGTTQVMSFSADQIYAKCENRPMHQRHHGWFVAFAPVESPEITVVALAEHSCSGSRGAAPIVKEVMKAYFAKYHPEKIQDYLRKTGFLKVEAPTNASPASEDE